MMRILGATAILGLMLAASAAPPAAPQGVAAEWSFAEASGAAVGDSSGSGVTGTLVGATRVSGRIGRGLSFDGVDDAVNLGANLPLLQNAPAATISGWIRAASLPANGAFYELVSISVGGASPTNTSRAALSLRGDGTRADLFAGGRSTDAEAQQTLIADVNLQAGTWYHVATVLDVAGDQIRVYVDGALVATGAAAFSAAQMPATAAACGALGAQDRADSNLYHGLMDEVKIHSRALSAAEIAALASGSELRAHWAFDEGAGASAADASPNAYTASLQNGADWATGHSGQAVRLEAANAHLSLGTNLPMLRNVNSATVAGWVRPSSLLAAGAFRELFSLSVGGAAPTNVSRIALALQGDGTGGDVFFGARSTDSEPQRSLVGNASLAVGEWTHVAGVVDYVQGTLTIYVNGALSATGPVAFSQSHTPNTPSAVASIGAQDTGDSNYLKGDLDDLRVFGRGLSACEIQELAGRDGLRLHLAFDEASGDTALDSSGSGLNGTLTNGATRAAGHLGTALSLDGTSDFVALGTQLPLLRRSHAATIAAWINVATLPPLGQYRELLSVAIGGAAPTNVSRAAFAIRSDGAAADLFAGGRSIDARSRPLEDLVHARRR
jgi:hypothetical protein